MKNLRNAIAMAREITSDEDVCELRADYVGRCAGYVDNNTERVLEGLKTSFETYPPYVVAVDKVRDKVVKKSGLSAIKVWQVETYAGVRNLYGYVERTKSSGNIVCDQGLNFCWKRFTILKELMHLYSDTTTDKEDLWANGNSYAEGLIKNAVDSRVVMVESVDQPLGDEAFAFYLALEVILPFALRQQLNRLIESSVSAYQIAKVFLMPKKFVNFFVDDSGRPAMYGKISQSVNLTVGNVI